jgi:hypothetical protein
MLDLDSMTELHHTKTILANRSLGINLAMAEEKKRLIDLGVVPNALENQDPKVYEVPEIAAYYLLAQIAGANTGQPIQQLLKQYEEWDKMAEKTYSEFYGVNR